MGKTAIIGFGCAGYHVAKALREEKRREQIVVYSDAGEAPANPMLVTYFVAGKIQRDTMFPYGRQEELSRELSLDLRRNASVAKLLAKEKCVVLQDGSKEHFDDVVIATGARPIVPSVPGMPENGVYVMRTPRDADTLRGAVEKGIARALILGASWVGVKVAEALLEYGVCLTMADMAPRVFPMAVLPDTAEAIHGRLTEKGIALKLGYALSSMGMEDGDIVSVFADGSAVRADAVILCLGLQPALEMLDPKEVEIGRGVRTDPCMRTNVPHVYAAGDCCENLELATGQSIPVNLLTHAAVQGRCAGRNIAGRNERYDGNFLHNITHFMDTDFVGIGDNRAQGERLFYRHPRKGWTLEAVIRDGRPVCLNILDNRELSGPAKAVLIRLFRPEPPPLHAAERYALKQAGLPESIITSLGDGIYERVGK